MSNIEVLGLSVAVSFSIVEVHTLIPSSEKQGGTAELSSSASLKSIGNFSTADIGISPL